MKLTARASSGSTRKLDSFSSGIGVRTGSNSKFRSKTLAKSRKRFPVAKSEAVGDFPSTGAGMPEIRIRTSDFVALSGSDSANLAQSTNALSNGFDDKLSGELKEVPAAAATTSFRISTSAYTPNRKKES
nr:hypothetical protein HannXRQ_Chr16g0530331 [Ipomoea batatas]